MSDKENKALPVALLVTGIICIMILSCCFVWLVVRCERYRRRRKYRPKPSNRYSMNASHIANGTELKEMEPRHLKPSVNLIHYASKNSMTSQSIPSLLSADSMDDSIASEPLYARTYEEDEPDADYIGIRDLSIARILGSFPALPFYPPSASSSVENVQNVAKTETAPAIPIARPRSTIAINSRPKEYSINSSLYTDYNRSVGNVSEGSIKVHGGDQGSTKSVSSADSLKVELPGGVIRIQDMAENFEFTKKKRTNKATRSAASSENNAKEDGTRPVFETEV